MAGVSARGGSRIYSLALFLLAVAAATLLVPRGQAAQTPKGGAAPGSLKEEPALSKTLTTKDGGSIHITYYKSLAGKESPVVVLLHQKDGNRFVWQAKADGFAEVLQKEGYAVITVDLRHHGESKAAGPAGGNGSSNDSGKKGSKKVSGTPELKLADYKAMIDFDMEAVKKFIYDEHQAENLNMNKMGIVGPEMGASIATLFAANDWLKEPHEDGQPGYRTPKGQDVRALVLISPQASFHGLAMAPAINFLRDPRYKIGFLFAVGKSDSMDKGQAKRLYDQTAAQAGKDKDDRIFYRDYPGKLRGTDLIGKRLPIEKNMLAFFNETLMKLDAPWRDRQSKLEKAK